ncbi:hypothetical protein BTR23_09260 [Alkalihalophilus pseudofirmus]|nr:hypothetical protein BTR23_09260 [Alkalihalophilus pseudofirmus]
MKNIIFLLIATIMAGLLFWFCNMMTPQPGQSSGNGNPAILAIPILCILSFFIVFLLIRIFQTLSMKFILFPMSMVTIVIYWMAALFYQRGSYINYRNILVEENLKDRGFVDWEYIDTITTFMSIHINNQFFNFNTYFVFLSFCIFVTLTIVLIKRLTGSGAQKIL